MHSSQRVLKAGVVRPRIDEICHPQLLNAAKPLKVWVRNDVEDQVALNMNEPVDRIVDDFLLVQGNTVTANLYSCKITGIHESA